MENQNKPLTLQDVKDRITANEGSLLYSQYGQIVEFTYKLEVANGKSESDAAKVALQKLIEITLT
jgi:hypothetical protein